MAVEERVQERSARALRLRDQDERLVDPHHGLPDRSERVVGVPPAHQAQVRLDGQGGRCSRSAAGPRGLLSAGLLLGVGFARHGSLSSHEMLELLLLDGDRSRPVLLIPQFAPAGLDALALALLEAAPSGRRRLLPGSAQDAATPAVRSWHRDAWIALPAAE